MFQLLVRDLRRSPAPLPSGGAGGRPLSGSLHNAAAHTQAGGQCREDGGERLDDEFPSVFVRVFHNDQELEN